MVLDDDDAREKIRSYGSIVLLIVCATLGIVSVICAIAFRAEYDETDSALPGTSAGLIIAGIVGQLVCGGCALCIKKTSESLESCNEGCGFLPAMGVMALAVIWLGILQLIETILMAVVTAENTAPNVQAFGGFITAINGIITMLSITYCCFIHGPLLSKIDIRTIEAY